MKVKITQIYRSDKDKNGNLLKTADGRPYERIAIKTAEYGDRWISGFGNRRNRDWRVGDVVDIEISEVEKDGQIYLNFETPSRLDLLEERIGALEVQVDALISERINKPTLTANEFGDKNDLPF